MRPASSWWPAALLAVAGLIAGCTNGATAPPPSAGPTTSTLATLAPLRAPAGRLVYSLRDAKGVHLWVADSDGRNRRQLTKGGGTDFDPHFSPDGRQVLFRTSRGRYAKDYEQTGTEGIFVINADGSGERQLFPPAAGMRGGLFANWAPDGRRVALSTVLDAGGGLPRTASQRSPARSAAGETIVVVDLHGRILRDLHSFGECSAFSPDGRRILFCSHRTGPWQAWVMRADGSGQSQVSRGPGDTYSAAWSPDGTQVVYGSGTAGIRVARPDGSGEHRVPLPVPGAAAGWWPDGRILFSWEDNKLPPTHWGLVRPDGSGAGRLPVLDAAGEVDFHPAPG